MEAKHFILYIFVSIFGFILLMMFELITSNKLRRWYNNFLMFFYKKPKYKPGTYILEQNKNEFQIFRIKRIYMHDYNLYYDTKLVFSSSDVSYRITWHSCKNVDQMSYIRALKPTEALFILYCS